jgi:hypothetical protein
VRARDFAVELAGFRLTLIAAASRSHHGPTTSVYTMQEASADYKDDFKQDQWLCWSRRADCSPGRQVCRLCGSRHILPIFSSPRPSLRWYSAIDYCVSCLICENCSGAGKTTLVDVLAGRVDYSGSYTMNGQDVSAELVRKKSAYVQQEDMFFPYLTVREHLWFQAQLRLPSTMPQEEKDGEV